MGLIDSVSNTQKNDSMVCCIKRINVFLSELKPGLGDLAKTNKLPRSGSSTEPQTKLYNSKKTARGAMNQPSGQGAFICRVRRSGFEVFGSEAKEQPWPQPLCLCSHTGPGRALNERCG